MSSHILHPVRPRVSPSRLSDHPHRRQRRYLRAMRHDAAPDRLALLCWHMEPRNPFSCCAQWCVAEWTDEQGWKTYAPCLSAAACKTRNGHDHDAVKQCAVVTCPADLMACMEGLYFEVWSRLRLSRVHDYSRTRTGWLKIWGRSDVAKLKNGNWPRRSLKSRVQSSQTDTYIQYVWLTVNCDFASTYSINCYLKWYHGWYFTRYSKFKETDLSPFLASESQHKAQSSVSVHNTIPQHCCKPSE